MDDLEIAEASIRFAIENCPAEGLLSTEDGTPVSLDELQALFERLGEFESGQAPGAVLGADVAGRLKSIIDYTSENCPVEGVATFHGGRQISGRSITTLAAKLGG